MRTITRFLTIVASTVSMIGCAAGPQQMVYFPAGVGPTPAAVWPEPPETARLRFAGQLVGEQNFRPVNGDQAGSAVRLLRWIAGVGGGRERVTELVRPQSGAVDSSGRILVTDVGQQAVLVFDEAAATLSVWTDAAGDQPFRAPIGIVTTADNQILIADAELGIVARLAPDGAPLGAIGGDELRRPTGIALDPETGEIFVADSAAHDVKVFGPDGELRRTIGSPGTGPVQFNGPTHLSFAGGLLYVTDTLNARVQVLAADGSFRNSIGQRGLFVGNLVRPKGVTTDSDGNIYVIESHHDHLLIFDENGRLLLPIGGTGNSAGRFFLPSGAWSDHGDRLFVADMFNGRVVIFDYLGEID